MINFFAKKNTYRKSYSQQGEDLVVDFILQTKGVETPFYLDIGANHPTALSNTYYFYLKGGKGICIEPNVAFKSLYSKFRKRDLLLSIGVTGEVSAESPYYVMNWHEFNTFDKKQADDVEKQYAGRNDIKEIVNLPILNINEILAKHINQKIDFLNIDVEGLDLNILKAFNFDKFQPSVICVEMKDLKTGNKDSEIQGLLEQKGYSLTAKNMINGIFTK